MNVRTAMAMGACALWAAACVPATFEREPGETGDLFGAPFSPFPPFGGRSGPDDVPPQVRAALPEGIDPSFAVRGGDGCWSLVLEETTPRRGVPLTGPTGERVCT